MNKIDTLCHIHKELENGVKIFILDKGEIINSESEAMLQALHSRSVGGIASHLEILKEKGAENFMSNFYVGYGHKSIGDCGSMTIFIEGISMLAAKAIQDSKLYNGQESSTRYIDFSEQKILHPSSNELGDTILEKQRAFYLHILGPIEKHFRKKFPCKDGEKESVYNKAIKAKSFDIARGFLPAGMSTNIAWHNNLRQISDKILQLRHHPLQEVREIAAALEDAVIEKYPSSFSKKRYEETETYLHTISDTYYYHNNNTLTFGVSQDNIIASRLAMHKAIYENRPNGKTELPTFLNNDGNMEFEFLLDFGSFRDLQRHRAINQRMPLLTDSLGFNEWYFSQLPDDILSQAQKHLSEIKEMTDQLHLTKEERQYYIPMGYNVSCQISGTLPAMVYMIELRSSQHVHPTLRLIAQQIGDFLINKYHLHLFVENTDYEFDLNRGKNDILLKE